MIIRADELLGLYKLEKKKRGKFTYRKLPQANLEYAKESVDNAFKFFKNIYTILGKFEMDKNKRNIENVKPCPKCGNKEFNIIKRDSDGIKLVCSKCEAIIKKFSKNDVKNG